MPFRTRPDPNVRERRRGASAFAAACAAAGQRSGRGAPSPQLIQVLEKKQNREMKEIERS